MGKEDGLPRSRRRRKVLGGRRHGAEEALKPEGGSGREEWSYCYENGRLLGDMILGVGLQIVWFEYSLTPV